ncbi:MAG: glycosyl transferase, group 2 family [Firmicutes bacterium]|nr:glycosyl transferase, group 2 family [Bacillota bacterium]
MKKTEICFIICSNNVDLCKKAQGYIRKLIIPEGFNITCVVVNNANSITSAYNDAMNSSEAKFKVYLHQDTFIINVNFINDIIAVFNKYPQIGMIGLAGAKKIASNGVWWKSVQKYGKVLESSVTGRIELLSFDEVYNDFENVEAIDGFIMITQYDVRWREELFNGWHFYDISQSIEFLRAGYEVCIPRQNSPWCIHACGAVNLEKSYEKYRNIFLKEYMLNGVVYKDM